MFELCGLKNHTLERAVRGIRPRRDLPRATPLDTVAAAADEFGEFPALCYRDALEPAAGTKVLATYKKDGSPAMIVRPCGKGTVYYAGALVGLAYLAPAMPPSSDVLPTAFPAKLRNLILLPVADAKVVSPVTTSEPLVEAQYLTGTNGDLVTLTNWRENPVEKLIVRFPGRPVKSVRSLRAAGYFKGALHEQSTGLLPVQTVDGVSQVELTLAVTDVLLVD